MTLRELSKFWRAVFVAATTSGKEHCAALEAADKAVSAVDSGADDMRGLTAALWGLKDSGECADCRCFRRLHHGRCRMCRELRRAEAMHQSLTYADPLHTVNMGPFR